MNRGNITDAENGAESLGEGQSPQLVDHQKNSMTGKHLGEEIGAGPAPAIDA